MKNRDDRARLTSELRDKKYLDNYVEKWLKLETTDRPYVECEVCGYVSNASIHQHLLVPKECGSTDNRILHLCANCNYELRALIDRCNMVPERIPQVCEEALERLKDKKKHYRDANKNLERVEV